MATLHGDQVYNHTILSYMNKEMTMLKSKEKDNLTRQL
jgi:hypothetical protein